MRAALKLSLIAAGCGLATAATAQTLTGAAAYGDWKTDAPGVTRKITPADMPAPHATPSSVAVSRPAPVPEGALPKTLPGFTVQPYAKLDKPRLIRVAPNGDVFVAESLPGRIRVLRARDGADKPDVNEVFVEGLTKPFGIAFYPAGPDPKWVYVAETDRIVRFPYHSGDLKASGAPEVLVPKLTVNDHDHWTRDILFSPDGKRMIVSVGSSTNTAENMPKKSLPEAKAWDQEHGFGTSWGDEVGRADVLSFDPMGKDEKLYASGIRNCVGLTRNPTTQDLWCTVNERDTIGDNLAPDYTTRVKEGGFYGWPWYYIGSNEDPAHKGERPDLAGKVSVPDVLLQAHSAALQLAFYPTSPKGPAAFPKAFAGQGFVTLHGSWNRNPRTGYKVVIAKLNNGVPTGEYEDFLTGFVSSDNSVWGRPVGVAVAKDGALLVGDDSSGWIWRVAPEGKATTKSAR